MKKHNTLKYEAQALAIAMVLTVVTAIIAMSVYFRTQKDKGLTLEERASAEALEVSDLIIDRLTQYNIETVVEKIIELRPESGELFDYVEGTVPPLTENGLEKQEISNLLSALGSETNIRELTICPVSENSPNQYELTIKQADENTYFEIKPGQVWSLPIKGYTPDTSPCDILISFSVRGNTGAGFVLTKSYAKEYELVNPLYKKYEYEDITSYCFSDDGVECNEKENFSEEDSWVKYNISSEAPLEAISLFETKVGDDSEEYRLDEIRVKAVGGTVGLKYKEAQQNTSCLDGLRLIHLRVTANCYGIYRGKEVLIPQKKWHNTLFDYAVFNATGSI